jgi:homoserine dehydrogenase
MTAPLRIGIAGLGTVGSSVVHILRDHTVLLEARSGRALTLHAASVRDIKKKRSIDMSTMKLVDDPLMLATSSEIDVVVELIGGADGIAKQLVETALKHGKSVVTANKALIAHHGVALAELAEAHGVVLAFEAAVAGGIPVIKTLRDGLAANQFTRIEGILNGTCNYILTEMWNDKRGFDDVLKEAQAKGYAEADPSFDVDGIDAAHKLAILASLAFGMRPNIAAVQAEGIRAITLTDMEFAEQLGYRIKLLGVANVAADGVEQRVYPCMVPISAPLANVHGVLNAVALQGDFVGELFLEGAGAGGKPTASSVVADLVDVARGVAYKPFSIPVAALTQKTAPKNSAEIAYYVRLTVKDRAGVLADVTRIFHEHDISVCSMVQPSHKAGSDVQVILTTHPTAESAMQAAAKAIAALPTVLTSPHLIRMLAI